MKNKYYTYIHLNPESFEVFYVGKGTGNRSFDKSKRNSEWKQYVKTLNTDFKVLILRDNQTSEEAEQLEQLLITKIGSVIDGGTLLNKDGLGFDPNMLFSLSFEEESTKYKSKYHGWPDQDIINDLLNFPNIEFGNLAEQRFDDISDKFNSEYEEIEEYNPDMLIDLVYFYDDLESLLEEFRCSSIESDKFFEELENIEDGIAEFRSENEDQVNELIERALAPIEREILKLKKENYS